MFPNNQNIEKKLGELKLLYL